MQGEDIADLVASTLNEQGEGKMEDLVSSLTDYVFYGQMMKEKRTMMESGPEVQFNAIVKKSSNARWVGIGEADRADITNVLASGKMPWRHFTSNWSYDEREVSMNPTSRRILNLVKTREAADTVDVAEEMEDWAWSAPDATATKEPGNLRYWIVSNITGTSATTGGFNGTVPTGFTTVGNISSTTYPNWANWTKKYASISNEDLVDAIDMAFYKTGFKSPIKVIPAASGRDDFEMFSTKTVVKGLEKLARANNDNLGKDLLTYRGQVLVNRIPVIPVPQLDANDSSDTYGWVFGVNWGVLKIAFLKGEYWKRTGPLRSGSQHTMWTIHNDLSTQTICTNRRKLFCISKA